MKRTICLKLTVPQNVLQAIFDLSNAFVQACNIIAEIAEQTKEKNRVALHHKCYYTVKEQLPALGSQMICNAIAKVAFALKGLKKQRKILFKSRSSIHFDKRTYSLKGTILSLYTLQGRMQIPLVVSEFHKAFLEKGTVKEAELVFKGRHLFFNLVLDLEDVPVLSKQDIMGVDFGENNLAATSTGKLFGGGQLKMKRDNYLAHRRRLQSNGSQAAKQRLRKISGREKRHVRYINHCVSKEIVEEALRNNCSTLVLEDLKNIRLRIKGGKRLRSRLNRWAFDQLRQFVEYKAAAKGIKVVYVKPAYTSQTCSCCQSTGNRLRHCFSCLKCGSLQHSDLNASRNLRRLGISVDVSTGDVNHRHIAA